MSTTTPTVPASTPTKSTPSAPSPFIFNDKAVADKLGAVNANLAKYIGKPGYNPYIYQHKSVTPLVARLEGGEKTKELQEAIFALNETLIPEAPGEYAEQNRKDGCVEPQSAGKSHALGQQVRLGRS